LAWELQFYQEKFYDNYDFLGPSLDKISNTKMGIGTSCQKGCQKRLSKRLSNPSYQKARAEVRFLRRNFHVEMLSVDDGLSEPFSIPAGFCQELLLAH